MWRASAAATAALLLVVAPAQAAEPTVARLAADPRVRAALTMVREADARTLATQIALSEVPAPTFSEADRAEAFANRLAATGLGVQRDRVGNVVARRPGRGGGPLLVVSAHLDTVFPAGADVRVRRDGDRYYGPGLQDDARGLAVVVALAETLQQAGLATGGDILFVGTVGEEGQGDLRGVKALLADHPDVDGFISVDGADMSELVTSAIGSRRWILSFAGPGGHSFENFGRPSAVHALGRAVAAIADLRPPPEPLTTFTVGVVQGGTSVNAIAGAASAQVDIRSGSPGNLAAFEAKVLATGEAATREENARWSSGSLTSSWRLTGDRPVGRTADDATLIRAYLSAAAVLGSEPPRKVASSGDSNLPMSLRIPAITVPGGGEAGGQHSPGEWYRPTSAWLGPQRLLLTVLAAVGLDPGVAPTLPRRTKPELPR